MRAAPLPIDDLVAVWVSLAHIRAVFEEPTCNLQMALHAGGSQREIARIVRRRVNVRSARHKLACYVRVARVTGSEQRRAPVPISAVYIKSLAGVQKVSHALNVVIMCAALNKVVN